MQTLRALAESLEAGRATSAELVEAALAAIAAKDGQGATAFLCVDRDGARHAAAAADKQRARGAAPSPFCGIPISIKDLFDVQGQVTRAGSQVLRDNAPAAADAPALARLRGAGFVFIGRTNMTEFAYSGLGLNPHYGTPLNPHDRATGLIPGGSSSGGAVSVTDGMAAAAIGTDTGGSCRIPAAMCGIVGYKPTAFLIPRAGVVPLSASLDSVGPLAASVECCAILHRAMQGSGAMLGAFGRKDGDLRGLRLGMPAHYVFDGVEAEVAASFERAAGRLRERGAAVVDVPFPDLERLPAINAGGGLAAAESFAWHRRLLAEKGQGYDPRVSARIRKGAEQSAADYIDVLAARADLMRAAQRAMQGFDAFIYPTVPLTAPPLAQLRDDDDEYARVNLLALRNPSVANFLDACAISLPVHEPGAAPVGLNALGRRNEDAALLALAAGMEQALRPDGG